MPDRGRGLCKTTASLQSRFRCVSVGQGRSHRLVHQFFIQNWKDFDANLNTSLVLEFVRAVRQEAPVDNKQPIVVHCR